MVPKRTEPKSAKDILMSGNFVDRYLDSAKYVSVEHQDFGLRLATRLNDLPHKALYIKIAKDIPRNLIEKAVSFTLDYPQAKSYGKIFMWKLVELCKEGGVKFSFRKKAKAKAKVKATAKAKAPRQVKPKKVKKESDQIGLL
jgi:hypothetical protein